MSEYSNEDWGMDEEIDKVPQKENKARLNTAKTHSDKKNVRFNMKGDEKEFSKTNPYDKKVVASPVGPADALTDKSSKKKLSPEEIEHKRRNLTVQDIISESKTN